VVVVVVVVKVGVVLPDLILQPLMLVEGQVEVGNYVLLAELILHMRLVEMVEILEILA